MPEDPRPHQQTRPPHSALDYPLMAGQAFLPSAAPHHIGLSCAMTLSNELAYASGNEDNINYSCYSPVMTLAKSGKNVNYSVVYTTNNLRS